MFIRDLYVSLKGNPNPYRDLYVEEFEKTGGISSYFSPESLGPLLWYDANDLSTITKDGSERVSQWDDKSGNGNHATQASDPNKPIYSPASINGLPAVYFNSGNAHMGTGTNWPIEFEIFVIAMPVSLTNLYERILSSYDGSSAFTNGEFAFSTITSCLRTRVEFRGSGVDKAIDIFQQLVAGTAYRFNLSADASKVVRLSINDTESSSLTHDSTSAAQNITIGEDRIPGALFKNDKKMGEIIVYDKKLTSPEKDAVVKYLNSKWGI